MGSRARLAATLAAALLAAPAGADETTFCNSFITSLPYTVTAQGHYCFNRNLSTPITNGAAITINSDYVVLDLNNFKLGGGSAGAATEAIGVHARNRSNLTIRGGNIRGFAFGVVIEGDTPTSAKNVLVAGNVVDGNLKGGILAYGEAMVVRDNVVSQTGGSTWQGIGTVWNIGRSAGISNIPLTIAPIAEGPSIDISGNLITGVAATGDRGFGIWLNFGENSVTGNVIRDISGGQASHGVFASQEETVCRENTVFGTTVKYTGCTTPAGSNH
jgi:putative cofactor-binding repeat protein